MYPSKSSHRVLQQQQPSDHDVRQQQSGSTDFQRKPEAQPGSPSQSQSQSPSQSGGGQQMGEGSYEGTRDYQKNIKGYLDNADVEKDAENARPRSESEAKDLEDAEREGKSHSKGER